MSRRKSSINRFRPGLRPGPRWGSLRRSPRPSGEGDTPSPFPTPLDAFGVSLLSAFGASISAPVPSHLIFRCAANGSGVCTGEGRSSRAIMSARLSVGPHFFVFGEQLFNRIMSDFQEKLQGKYPACYKMLSFNETMALIFCIVSFGRTLSRAETERGDPKIGRVLSRRDRGSGDKCGKKMS